MFCGFVWLVNVDDGSKETEFEEETWLEGCIFTLLLIEDEIEVESATSRADNDEVFGCVEICSFETL